MKLHGGPNLARGPEFDTHVLEGITSKNFRQTTYGKDYFGIYLFPIGTDV